MTTIGAPPGPPLCPTTVVAGIGEVTITWCAPTNDNGSPVTCYQIYRWTTGTTAVLLANVCPGVAGANEKSTSTVRGSPADPTYVDTAVVCGSIYFYDTTASNTYGASVPSNVVSAAPGCGPGRGPAPSLQACSGETGNAAFVCAAYVDILGRAPDPGGLAYWEAALSSGESTGAVAAGIMSSGEFQADIVFGDYELFLGRAPDPGGLSFWEGELAAGTTDEQVIAGIAGSPEFGSRSGGTPAGIVGALYEDLLGRAPDPGGLAYWEGALSSGESTGAVATGICSSAEYRAGLVSDYYEHFLARGVDPAGLSFWEGRLAAGATDEQVMAGIVGSPEYYAEVTG